MTKVFIQGPHRLPHIQMWAEANADRKDHFVAAKSIEDADIVVWTGGEDINPAVYGQKPLPSISWNSGRDLEDIEAFRKADKKFKVGICRGAQLLNVLSGGSLWQDVDGHRSSHFVRDITMDERIYVSSTHHQQMIPGPSADVIAVADLSKHKASFNIQWDAQKDGGTNKDYEVLWYGNTRSLCFQPHPEHTYPNNKENRAWFFDLVDFYRRLEGTDDAKSA